MKINLQDIAIQNIPETPKKIWNDLPKTSFQDYRVHGYLGNEEIGYVTFSICSVMNDPEKKDDFWFEKKKKIWTPRPVAVFQRTHKEYRGQGVSGELLLLVNELVKQKYQMPLASATTFCECYGWEERGTAERPAIRVWEKLEQQGLAYSKPYLDNCHPRVLHPRWVLF